MIDLSLTSLSTFYWHHGRNHDRPNAHTFVDILLRSSPNHDRPIAHIFVDILLTSWPNNDRPIDFTFVDDRYFGSA